MKKHAIIPIFIPHIGCGHSCVFCNQNIITARSNVPTADDVRNTIETYLPTLRGRGLETVEVAFFGGSFTGIPMDMQKEYLSVAYEYKQAGKIHKIHMSTRPDYIDEEILGNLKAFSADTIELGVQSFDNEVLALSKRGHSEEDVYRACHLIKECGFELGIQLMIGLPGDTKEKAMESAGKAAAIKPELARLYPTVVLPDTELAEMYKSGDYSPLSESDAIDITKEMYKILMAADINIMRVGLKSTDLMTNDMDLGKGYHPAFRQLVEGEICREQMEQSLTGFDSGSCTFCSNEKWFSPMIGHKGSNKKWIARAFPDITPKYKIDNTLKDGTIIFFPE